MHSQLLTASATTGRTQSSTELNEDVLIQDAAGHVSESCLANWLACSCLYGYLIRV